MVQVALLPSLCTLLDAVASAVSMVEGDALRHLWGDPQQDHNKKPQGLDKGYARVSAFET